MPALADVPLERVVVLRALQGWGDALVAVPGLRALRVNHRDVHVTLVAAARAVPYWEPFGHYVDEVVVPTRVSSVQDVLDAVDRQLQRHPVDR